MVQCGTWSKPSGRVPGFGVTATVVVAVGVLVGFTVFAEYGTGTPLALFLLDVAVGAAGLALLPVLLRWPGVGAVALTVLAAVSPAATPLATVGALHAAQRHRFAVAAVVGAAGIVAHCVRGLWRPFPGLPFVWWVVLVVAGYAALVGWGALSRARRALVASLRERAENAEAEQGRRVAEARAAERARIAAEMHDVLAHRLSLLATYAGALEYRPDAPPQRLAHAARVVRAGVHDALDELREVIGVLRDDPRRDDAEQAPQPTLADVPALIDASREAGTVVELHDGVTDPDRLPATLGRAGYRVVQEALTNARKHATGQPVVVTMDGEPGTYLSIEVRNPLPSASDSTPLVPGSGTGLVGLTERVRLAGGGLDHGRSRGQFVLRSRLPWPA